MTMKFEQMKRLAELVSEYDWSNEYGLTVWINYSDCEEVFSNILNIDFESYVDCVAQKNCICVFHFDGVLNEYIPREDIEDMFTKEED